MKLSIFSKQRFVLFLMISALFLSVVPNAYAQTRDDQLEARIGQIIDGIPSTADTDAKVALYLHDYIVRNVEYQKVGDHQTAYGALLDGKAVCAGYADAYLRLLTAAGIRAYTIFGTADNGDGNLVDHAWTMLYIDGKCVFTDVTWDDPFVNGVQISDSVSYSYFQLSMEEMGKNHYPDNASKALLPATCNHTDLNYYTMMAGKGTGVGIFGSATTPGQAAAYFKYLGITDGRDVFVCDFRFLDDNMLGWISENWVDIALSLGLTGSLGVSYQYNENDAKMVLKGTLANKVSVTAVYLSASALQFSAKGLTAQLVTTFVPANATNKNVTFTSSNDSVATVTSNGLVTAKGNGTAVITVRTDDGGMTATCTVKVSIPAPPPTETTEPSQPTEATLPTEPVESETTVPSEPAEGEVPTQPEDTIPPTTAVPAETTQPQDDPAEPTQLPQGTDPTPGTTQTPTETEITIFTTGSTPSATASRPATPPTASQEQDSGRHTVVTIVLASGGVLVGALVVFLILKRRF